MENYYIALAEVDEILGHIEEEFISKLVQRLFKSR